MIQITGLTPQQVQIADMLWNCDSADEADRLIRNMPPAYRRDAVTIREMIVAAVLDQINDTPDARRVIRDLVDRL